MRIDEGFTKEGGDRLAFFGMAVRRRFASVYSRTSYRVLQVLDSRQSAVLWSVLEIGHDCREKHGPPLTTALSDYGRQVAPARGGLLSLDLSNAALLRAAIQLLFIGRA